MRRRTLALVASLAAGAALVVVAALRGARDGGSPARCAPGLVALGARCCGEGQTLEETRCVGAPSQCGALHEITPSGCAPQSPNGRRLIEGGRLHLGPGDWEAQGVVAPYDADIATFEIDTFEVTEARWEACARSRACSSDLALTGEPGLPVTNITFDEAAVFCRFAGGRLPTRDELTFAISGSQGRRYPWGDTGVVCRRAAFGLSSGPCATGGTGPDLVGAHPDGASIAGVQDLAGNVAEWAVLTGTGAASDKPRADHESVIGGSWSDTEAASLRGWNLRVVPKSTRDRTIGFRCVYNPKP